MAKTYTFDENIVSDLYKDAYGHRPSQSFWEMWNTVSDHYRQEIWDNLLGALDRAVESERAEFDERNAAVEGWFETEYAKVVG